MNFKNIYLGKLINERVMECKVEMPRICKFMKCSEEEILKMYKAKSIDTDKLLRWSKLLEYDFFRIYTQHLILYAPPSAKDKKTTALPKNNVGALPKFRKNIYTQEIIEFILEQIENGEMSKTQVIETYKIPKTTLYKWLKKHI